MIIGGKYRTNGKQLGAYLGDYLQAGKNDRVELIELRGSGLRGLTNSIASWEAEAKGSKCENPLWHAHLRTPAGEHLTREQQIEAVNILEKRLGFQGQPRAIVIHENDGHEHVHAVWSRIRRTDETIEVKYRVGKRDKSKEVDDRPYKVSRRTVRAGTAKDTSFTKIQNCAAAREIEERFGLQKVDSPDFNKDAPREDRRENSKKASNYGDHQKAKRTGLDPIERKKTITAIWQASDSGKALRAALLEAGYILAKGDSRNFVVVDQAGDIHSLARQVKGAFKRDIDARLKDVDPASVPRATHVQQQQYFAWKERQAEGAASDDEPKRKKAAPKPNPPQTLGQETTKRQKRQNPFEQPERDPLDPGTILKALTRSKSTFTESDMRWEIGKRLKDTGDPNAAATLEKSIAFLPDFVRLGEDATGRQRFSSKDMVDTEKALATAAETLAGRFTHDIGREALDAAPSAKKLTEEQRAVSEYILAPGALKLVEGIAGGGKSTTMKPVNEAAIGKGYRTRGLAVAGIAAQGLQDSTGIPSGTIMSFIMDVARLDENRERLNDMDRRLGRYRGSDYFDKKSQRDQLAARIDRATLSDRDILFIDEAGMLGTRQMNTLLGMASSARAKVVMIGDSEQLQAIDAGGPFRFLTERHGAAKISEVWRQKEDWQKQATRDFRDGETQIALQTYRDQGHVHEIANGEDARDRVLTDWNKSRPQNEGQTHLMLAFTNDDVDTLNERARQTYKADGLLGQDNKVQTADGPRTFASGERVSSFQNSKALQVMNGTLGTIEQVERIGKSDDHQITVKLDKGDRSVKFSTKEYNDLTYGYAATIHKTQGATADRATVLASKYMDRHATYVAMSRHTRQVDMYYSDADFKDFGQLEAKLSREARKDMALDYIDKKSWSPQPAKPREPIKPPPAPSKPVENPDALRARAALLEALGVHKKEMTQEQKDRKRLHDLLKDQEGKRKRKTFLSNIVNWFAKHMLYYFPVMAERSPTSSYSRPDRSNLKTIVAFVDPDKAYNVKSAAMRTGATVQMIADLALTEWLERFDAGDKKTLANLRDAVGNRVTPGPKINPLAKPVRTA